MSERSGPTVIVGYEPGCDDEESRPNPWDRPAVSREELAKEREASVRLLVAGYGFDEHVRFTCDACRDAVRCKLAFDGYNTDGDCLYSK